VQGYVQYNSKATCSSCNQTVITNWNLNSMASKHGIGTSLFMQHHHHTALINNRPSTSKGDSWAELN
jgi:hypothetical protein